MNRSRIEKDALGECAVPEEVYWGIHTQRALANFRTSGRRVPTALIRAFALVKKAAALANAELGYLPQNKARALCEAADEIAAGRWDDQFRLDALQGGAGTSTNMNVNEVITNRALEILGFPRGRYDVIGPLDHVNLHQSTNDTFPTALKVAAFSKLKELSEAAELLQGAFQDAEKRFEQVVFLGRTELMPAVPMTLGSQFSSFAEALGRDRWRTFKCQERIRQVNLGGTAVGTGLCAPRDYIFRVAEKLRDVTGLGLASAENRIDHTANQDAFLEVSGILKAYAGNLFKISGDLRHLAVFGVIVLPKMQAGSSIMPGKTNPVILESVLQGAWVVMANDGVLANAVSAGSLQINEFMPLVAACLLENIEILDAASRMLAGHVSGIRADEAHCAAELAGSTALITAFVPQTGYDGAVRLLKEYEESGRTDFRKFLEEKLGPETVTRTLNPQNLIRLGYSRESNT